MPNNNPDVEALIEAGHLEEAARACETAGDAATAIELFEKVWEYGEAARVARQSGDLPRALFNYARAQDTPAVDEVFAELLAAPPEARERAIEVCRERGMLDRAAELLVTLGEKTEAAALFAEAGLELDAAVLLEEGGKPRQALDYYRAYLARGDDDPRADEARLLLGRLLARFGRHAEAVTVLQAVRGDLDRDARRATAAALYRAGYPTAARATIELLRTDDPETPALEVILADTQLAPIENDDAEATVLAGRYRLGELLGSGGMGSVYLADDLLSGKRVAVKVFNAPGGDRGRDAFKRFVREATITGKLEHPHIVRLIDFSEELGYLVLEQMEGGTLAQRVRTALPLAQTREIALQLLEALAAAHQRGIVHRDLKPSNIFFSAAGAAKLGDFGVAHLQDSGQTQTGAFIGTIAYMSPEQISGVEVTFATDLYALGVTLFWMITAQLPFTPPDLVRKHLEEPPPLPSSLRDDVPKEWDRLILRCLAKDPDERFESLDELRRELRAAPADVGAEPMNAPRRARPTGPRRRAADARYGREVALYPDDGQLELVIARDQQLARQVLLVRVAEGPRPRVDALLAAAAHANHRLQRLLDVGPTPGNAVIAAAADLVWSTPASELERIEAARALASALAALHHAGIGHGALEGEALRDHGGTLQVALAPALIVHATADAAPMPKDDIDQLRTLLALDIPEAITDAQGLAPWLDEAATRAEEAQKEARWQAALRDALQSAPPGVER